MLRLRLIYGFSLAGLIIGLMIGDAWLTTLNQPNWVIAGLEINFGHWLCNGAVCTALLAVFVWLVANELVRFARSIGYQPLPYFTQVGAVGLVIGPYVIFNSLAAAERTGEAWSMLLLAIMLGLAFLHQAWQHGAKGVMINLATTMFIILYTGGLGHFLARLRMEVGGTQGVALLLFSVFVVKMTDVGAYFTGRLIGRHKLIPWLSPKKTWEGFVGGIVVAAFCSLGIGHLLETSGIVHIGHNGPSRVLILLVFGLLMAALSAAGDLCASLLKRDAAVKDSGEALPGLGGILDVLDSPLLAAPAAWFFWTRAMQIST